MHFTDCALAASRPLTCRPPVHLQVRGEVHHDRRLHQLMLQEGEKAWNSSRSLPSKPRSARVDITGRASVSSVALGSPSDSAGSMHAADCSPLDLADPLALYRWGLGWSGCVLLSVSCAGSAYCGLAETMCCRLLGCTGGGVPFEGMQLGLVVSVPSCCTGLHLNQQWAGSSWLLAVEQVDV